MDRISAISKTKDENTKTKDLLIKYARDPNRAALFNYASAAHNNHLFFETLVTLLPPLSLHPSSSSPN
ncbi:MAG: hypothetical protein Q9223_006572 [Gallowayella weberi]